ncbi:MAG: sulfotransferase [Sphingomonadaceae bacterium]
MNEQSVFYISGSGRSGSTLLERVLHSSRAVSAIGEFHCLWRLPMADINCSCGNVLTEDAIWQEILAKAQISGSDISELSRLENEVSRSGYIARHRFSLASLRKEPQVQRFLELQFRIFDAASSVMNTPVIIDSSKAGPRAWILACQPNMHIIHLYREPADVIASWRSRKFDKGLGTDMQRLSVTKAAADWWKAEAMARKLSGQAPVTFIDYEAMCREPRKEVGHLLKALSLESLPPVQWCSDTSFMTGGNYHSLNGNPDRFYQGEIEISHRDANMKQYSGMERKAIQMAGALLRTAYPPRG